MTAYYNEIDPYAAQWLRNLIAAGHIAPGDVDERSIEDVKPDDIRKYTQCHFFVGIGVWSHSLRLAGWPDDREVWTGSCPCQPFSAAGKQKGTADARHLWPAWFRLIRECRPGVVFGEQVSAAIRQGWLDLVSTDLEGVDYRIGAAVLGAHSVGAPHIRQRLYFVADSERRTAERHGLALAGAAGGMQSEVGAERLRFDVGNGVNADKLAHAQRDAGEPRRLAIEPAEGVGASGAGAHAESGRRGVPDELGHADDEGPQGRGLLGASGGGDGASECAVGAAGTLDWFMADLDGGIESDGDVQRSGERGQQPQDGGAGRFMANDETGRRGEVDPVAGRRDEGNGSQGGERLVGGDRTGFWSACDWLPCIDGKARPVEPLTQQMADGAAASLGYLRSGDIEACEKEIDETSKRYKVDAGNALRNLWTVLQSQAFFDWGTGKRLQLHEAPFLLAFLRQLTDQGWGFAQSIPRPSTEASKGPLRVLLHNEPVACASCGRGLDEQCGTELANFVHFLSSILARHAQAAWGEAYDANARVTFPLIVGAPARVERLRAYGNAIVAPLAEEFISAYMAVKKESV